MRIGITGADGFLGWHLRCNLLANETPFVCANRTTFSSNHSLDEFVRSADAIIHVAGVNRADTDKEVADGNVGLAKAIVSAAERTGASPAMVFANSVKTRTGGAYGDSKAEAASILGAHASTSGAVFSDVLLPHLFGEFGAPHYNSAVSTFAYQLARKEESVVNEGELELLHAQGAADILRIAAAAIEPQVLEPKGDRISVPDCYERMRCLASYVESGVVPDMNGSALDLRLFNTIRSQMWPDAYPMQLVRHEDDRGAFFEVVRAWGQGQTSISTTVPGITRGEHFHFDKVERFAVISGRATIRVRKLFSDLVHTYEVVGRDPCFIDMPPLCTHNITNTGTDELVTLFWSHDHFDPDNADTYPLPVVGDNLAA